MQVEDARKAVAQQAVLAYGRVAREVNISAKSLKPTLTMDPVNQAVWVKAPSKLVRFLVVRLTQ